VQQHRGPRVAGPSHSSNRHLFPKQWISRAVHRVSSFVHPWTFVTFLDLRVSQHNCLPEGQSPVITQQEHRSRRRRTPWFFEQQTSGKKNNNTMGRPLFTPQWRTQQRYVYTPPSCGIWESYLSTGVEDNWCRALPISEFSAPEPRPPRKPSEARRQVLASESSAGAHRPTSEPSEARRARRLAGPQLEQHRPTSKPSEEKEFATILLLGGISPSNCAPLSREDAPRATARPFAREIAINKLKEKLMPD
jgi:hypothetical protein